jgi:ankyrin repeat protein
MSTPYQLFTLSLVVFLGSNVLCSQDSATILHSAIFLPKDYHDSITTLHKQGADINIKNHQDVPANLHLPIKKKYENDIIKILIDNKNKEQEGEDECGSAPRLYFFSPSEALKAGPAIVRAAFYNETATVSSLLGQSNINVNERGFKDGTALFWAACHGNIELVKLLLSSKVIDANASDDDGDTPLMAASQYGHDRVVALLVADSRVDKNKQNKFGQTALHSAQRLSDKSKRELLVNILVQAGVDTELTDAQGKKAVDCRLENIK